MQTVAGDGVASIKRRRRDQSSDDVRIMVTASGRGRLKDDLESSTWRRHQDCKATPSRRQLYKYKSVFKLDFSMKRHHVLQSFTIHLMQLMCSWAVVCDVITGGGSIVIWQATMVKMEDEEEEC
ncbi:hypothetical protein Tco_0657142 [Tanacetum coccineum]|uniref:Uncharacterized protein n=1 Tax=Tanacetum coccineum TaxID=301880 RepID=A0ABQ4XBH5_9ASTR